MKQNCSCARFWTIICQVLELKCFALKIRASKPFLQNGLGSNPRWLNFFDFWSTRAKTLDRLLQGYCVWVFSQTFYLILNSETKVKTLENTQQLRVTCFFFISAISSCSHALLFYSRNASAWHVVGENFLEIMKPLPGSDFVQATETGWDSMDASDEQLYRELKWLVPTTSLSTYVTAGRWHRKLLQVDLELIKAEVLVFIRHHVNHVLSFDIKNFKDRAFSRFHDVFMKLWDPTFRIVTGSPTWSWCPGGSTSGSVPGQETRKPLWFFEVYQREISETTK